MWKYQCKSSRNEKIIWYNYSYNIKFSNNFSPIKLVA